jgi:hypothetical protein
LGIGLVVPVGVDRLQLIFVEEFLKDLLWVPIPNE